VIVVLQLVPDGQHRDCFTVFDFEQCDVSAAPKRDDQLPQKRRIGSRFAARERRTPERSDAIANRLQSVFGEFEISDIALKDNVVKSLEIGRGRRAREQAFRRSLPDVLLDAIRRLIVVRNSPVCGRGTVFRLTGRGRPKSMCDKTELRSVGQPLMHAELRSSNGGQRAVHRERPSEQPEVRQEKPSQLNRSSHRDQFATHKPARSR
jgi:hypothetical protein